MDYREELALRLRRVPFSAAQVADRAGKSRAYVARVKSGEAPGLTLETARMIHAGIDALILEATGMEKHEAPEHIGVRTLAADSALCRAHHITPAELQELSALVLIRHGQDAGGGLAAPGPAAAADVAATDV